MTRRIPTGKTYSFESIKDITSQLTDEQVDDFVEDFRQYLHATKTGKIGDPEIDKLIGAMRDFSEALGEIMGEELPEELKGTPIDGSRFRWIDDGAHKTPRVTVVGVDPITKRRTEVFTIRTEKSA